jgi:hypothetical protein
VSERKTRRDAGGVQSAVAERYGLAFELPDAQGVVRAVDADPDYTRRPEPAETPAIPQTAAVGAGGRVLVKHAGRPRVKSGRTPVAGAGGDPARLLRP